MIETSCFFTGHRILPAAHLSEIRRHLEVQIRLLIQIGVTDFLCGGAQGFDLMAGVAVWNLQQEFPKIRLRMYLPYPGFEDRWPEENKVLLHRVCGASAEVRYVSKKYFPGCLRVRNEALVRDAGYGIAFRLAGRSGTAQTMAIARKQKRNIVNLADLIYDVK